MKISTKNIKLYAFSLVTLFVAAVVTFTLSGGRVSANHSWGGYHWARTSNSFTLKLSSNLTSSWQPYLVTASNDWSQSSVLNTTVIQGVKNPKTCKPTAGRVEVCNAKYGANGWLGLAQIWINSSQHITQGAVKMNDTYMTRAPYNTTEEKNHVMCQEVGHTFGLGHQDETGAVLNTCMDYSMSAASQHPNAHDYAMLEQIYSHLDPTNTVDTSASFDAALENSDLNNNQNWGRRVFRAKSGLLEVYEKEYKDGTKLVSLVTLVHHD